LRQMIAGITATGLLTAALAACATTPPPDQGPPASDMASCKAEPVQSYVGQRAEQAVGAAILKASGARSLRWGPPDTAWTMDFREDRVNVQYDAKLVIERINCG
jgi:Peptidase inhibitor I78 family